MRNKDDRNEFKEQQDAEIMDAYRRIFKIYGGKVDVHTLYKMVAFAPAFSSRRVRPTASSCA